MNPDMAPDLGLTIPQKWTAAILGGTVCGAIVGLAVWRAWFA